MCLHTTSCPNPSLGQAHTHHEPIVTFSQDDLVNKITYKKVHTKIDIKFKRHMLEKMPSRIHNKRNAKQNHNTASFMILHTGPDKLAGCCTTLVIGNQHPLIQLKCEDNLAISSQNLKSM